MFFVIFYRYKKNRFPHQRSVWVTKESQSSTHAHHASSAGKGKPGFPSFLTENFNMTLPDELTLSGRFTGLFPPAVMYVTRLWITLSSRQIGTKGLKCSKRSSFVCGAIVVSSCTGFSVSAPATLMFEKMNGERQKTVSVGDAAHNDGGGWKICGEMWKFKQILRVRVDQRDCQTFLTPWSEPCF